MSQRTIKHAWSQARLEELANKIGSGATPRGGEQAYQTDGIPLIRSQNVVFFNFKRDGLAFISEEQARLLSNVEVLANDVLLNITGASIGRVTIAPQDMEGARVNQHVCIIRPVDGIEVRYLNAYLSSPDKQAEITNENYGVTRQALTKQQIADFIVPVPPLNEQKRIADKLDAVLARVDACRESLDRVPGILKRFRQSVLAAATSGALTEDWREEKQIAFAWASCYLRDLGEFGRGKSKHRPRNDPRLYGGIYPFIQTGDVANSNGLINNHSQTYNEMGLRQSKLWPKGTLCITIAANIADTTLLSYSACFPDSIVGLVANTEKVLPQFIKWSVDTIANDLESFAPATAQKNINLGILNDVQFLIPTISEQYEIVRRVEALFAYADVLEAKYRKVRERVNRLTPALLVKAFRGELVRQDPNDEPAEKLLERIRGIRSAQPAATRTRRTRTPRQAARSTSAQSVSAMPAHADLPTTQTSLAPPVSSFDPTSAIATTTGSRTLADLRKAAGLNQAAVAKSMGLNQAYISQMETGKRAITEDQRCKLAEILGISLEEMP